VKRVREDATVTPQMAREELVVNHRPVDRPELPSCIDDLEADVGFVVVIFDLLIESADLFQRGSTKAHVRSLQIHERIGTGKVVLVEGRRGIKIGIASPIAQGEAVLDIDSGVVHDDSTGASHFRIVVRGE
jgi:hypothetical protein